MSDAESNDQVPAHLRDSHYRGASEIGAGVGYRYPHDFPGHWVEQPYRPERFQEHRYFEPSGQGDETTEWVPGS
jgi:putative ATPase